MLPHQKSPPPQPISPARRIIRDLARLVLLPLLLLYLAVAFVLALLGTALYLPRRLLAHRLYRACPFFPFIWIHQGRFRGALLRLGFETTYSINVLRRLLTLPLRRQLPDFYILGFPKAGSTSLANQLKRHPAISGLDGLPWHETLTKESHFFQGVFGLHHAHQAWLYRSYFPTVLTKWFAESVRRVDRWVCFDACPLNIVMPHVAARIARLTPHAKLIIMIRDPVSGVFSAETMLRNMGVPLPWTLIEQLGSGNGDKTPVVVGGSAYNNGNNNTTTTTTTSTPVVDPRFVTMRDEEEMWKRLEALGPTDPLPEGAMEFIYFRLGSYLRAGNYVDRIMPYLERFPKDQILFVSFEEYCRNEEQVVRQVLSFLGMKDARYSHATLPAGMKTDYKGRRMHPTVKSYLKSFYRATNLRLYQLLGVDFGWDD